MRRLLFLFPMLLFAACSDNPSGTIPLPYRATSFIAEKSTELTPSHRFDFYMATALLLDPSYYNTVDGGEVYFNGAPLFKGPGGRGPYYNHADTTTATVPMRFDGTFETFTVSGNANFPAMTDSIRSFDAALEITSPGPFDTVSRTSDLEVRWNASANAGDSVRIAVFGEHGSAPLHLVPDDGSHTISVAELGDIASGPLRISIYRSRIGKGALPDGRRYEMEIRSSFLLRAAIR
jgi:hypothetical protein